MFRHCLVLAIRRYVRCCCLGQRCCLCLDRISFDLNFCDSIAAHFPCSVCGSKNHWQCVRSRRIFLCWSTLFVRWKSFLRTSPTRGVLNALPWFSPLFSIHSPLYSIVNEARRPPTFGSRSRRVTYQYLATSIKKSADQSSESTRATFFLS